MKTAQLTTLFRERCAGECRYAGKLSILREKFQIVLDQAIKKFKHQGLKAMRQMRKKQRHCQLS